MQTVGFKEWALVCNALADGRQSVILRKGGIAEGRNGFAFRHAEFVLFPTYFHEQVAKTRLREAELPGRVAGAVEIRALAKVDVVTTVTSWEEANALEPLHILRSAVVRERFEYDGRRALHVALVRVFKLERPWVFPDSKCYGGCRSWVQLPEPPPDLEIFPVLTDSEHARRRERFLCAVGEALVL